MATFHLRREVFTHGILSSDLLHLTDANLLHLAQQISLTLLAHTSGSTAALKYTTWLQAAVELLRCSEHTAKIYFESFLGVHNKNVHKHGGPKLLLSADVGEFMLFLFIQRYRAAAAGGQSAMGFVQANLHVLLMLVRDPHKHVHDFSLPLSPHSAHSPRTPSSPSSSSSSSASAASALNHALDAHEFNRLGFLFFAHNRAKESEEQLERLKDNEDAEPPTERREVVNLASLTPFYSGQSSVAAASPTGGGVSVPLNVVEEWLLSHLAPTHGGVGVGADGGVAGRPVVHHGHLLYPPVVSVCEVSGWEGKAAVYGAREVQGGDLLVKQCTNSSLSVYTHSRYATVEECSHSSVNAGVVSGLLIVRNCSHLTLTAACRSIHISDCKHCTFFLFSASRPIILGGNTDTVTLAPYNTHYPSLSTDLSVTGLPTSVNCWSSPLLMSSGSGTTSSSLLHSPLRGGRSLSAGGGGGSHFSYHHTHSGGMGAPPSPPPPSSPRRSTSPSPLLASLSPPSRDLRDPQSSPTSPFRRSANSTHPISPSASASPHTFSATTLTSPNSTSASSSSLSPSTAAFSSTTPIGHSAAHSRGGRDRTRSLQPPERGRRQGVHRMSDGHEGDDSGSESTDDERRDEVVSAKSVERVGGHNGPFNRLHNRSASYSAPGEKKDASSAMSALKSHHAFLHSSTGGPTSLTSPPDHDHSPLHLSPASLSPPLNPMLHAPGVSTLSPLTVPGGNSTSSLNSFFPLSPHSASSTLAQAVTLLPPDQFYLLPPLPSADSSTDINLDTTPQPTTPQSTTTTTHNPFTLPSIYTDALAERPHRAIHARQLIDTAALNADEARLLRGVLTSGFESWLKERFSVAGIRQWVEASGGVGVGGEGDGGLGGVVQAMVGDQRVGGGTVHVAVE